MWCQRQDQEANTTNPARMFSLPGKLKVLLQWFTNLQYIIGSSFEDAKDNIIAKAKACGHVNERGAVKQLFFYSLIPHSMKYQLKKDLKRGIDKVSSQGSDVELKKMKKSLQEAEEKNESPVKCPNFSNQRKQTEETPNEIFNDPKIQTIVQITFSRMDQVIQLVDTKVKDLTKRVSQVENQITGIGHKLRSIQQAKRSTNATSSRGRRNNKTGRGGLRNCKKIRTTRSQTKSNWDDNEEEQEDLEIEEEEEDF